MKYLLLITAILFIGCNVQKRQVEKLQVFALRYPNEFARLSDLLNPCFDGEVKSDTIITSHTDTLTIKGTSDTLRINDTVRITIKLPGKQITNTKKVVIHDTIPDGRKVNLLNSQLKVKSDSLVKATTQMSDAKKAKNTWMWIAIGAILIIVVSLSIKAYKFFTGGGLKSLIK